jgi:hypothetical protein
LGLVGNWNYCVEHCLQTGEFKYIKFLFQDDLLSSDCLTQMVAAAEQDQQIGMVFSRRSLRFGDFPDLVLEPADPQVSALENLNQPEQAITVRSALEQPPIGNLKEKDLEPAFDSDRGLRNLSRYSSNNQVLTNLLTEQSSNLMPASMQWLENLHQHWSNLQPVQAGLDLLCDRQLCQQPDNKIGEPTNVLIKTAVFQKIGLFDPQIQQFCDLEMWWRIMAHYKVAFVDLPLATFRLHPQQTTNSNLAADRIWHEIYAVWLKLIQAPIYKPIPAKCAIAFIGI